MTISTPQGKWVGDVADLNLRPLNAQAGKLLPSDWKDPGTLNVLSLMRWLVQEKGIESNFRPGEESVLAMLDKLALCYKGSPIGDEIAEEAKSLRADKEIKKEVSAWQTLQKTLAGNKACKTKSDKAKNLRALQKSLEGTAAAAQAREIATAIEGSKLYK